MRSWPGARREGMGGTAAPRRYAGRLPILFLGVLSSLVLLGSAAAVAAPRMPDITSVSVVRLSPLVALIAGVLILIFPRLLNYIVAFYLIITGLFGYVGR